MQLTTHLSTPWRWTAELALLADLQRTVYPYKWLPISCRSGADLWKFADQRPTFYHWATQPTVVSQKIQILPVKSHDSGATVMDHYFCKLVVLNMHNYSWAIYIVAQKTRPPYLIANILKKKNFMTELRGNWWTSAILYAEHSH